MKISTYLIRENNNLDLIRVFLASLVIFGHSAYLDGGSRFWMDPIRSYFKFTYSGTLAVELFFFISGLVVTNSLLKNGSVIKFIISRTFRLIPGLLLVLLITAMVLGPIASNRTISLYFRDAETFGYIWSNLIFHPRYSLPGVFENNYYPITVNGSLWSLPYEVGCYIVLLALFAVIGSRRRKYLNAVLILIWVDTLLPNKILLGWLGSNPQINLLPFSFSLGAFFANNAENIEVDFRMGFGFLLFLLILHGTPLEPMALIACSSILIVLISSNTFVRRFRLKYDISYGIYLWGFVVQQMVYFFLGRIYTGFYFLLALGISIAFGYLSFRFVEWPSMKFGMSLYSRINTGSRHRDPGRPDEVEPQIGAGST